MTLLLACILAVAATTFVALRLRVGDLTERLVRDANTVIGAPRTRALHVDTPGPGTLGDALAKHLPPFEKAWRAQFNDKEPQALLRGVVDGTRPLTDVPAAYTETLTKLHDDLDGVLHGTRAALADLSVKDGFHEPAPDASWAGYQFAATLAGLRVRQEIESGRTSAAATDCLDILALARDGAVAGGLIGRMVATAIIEKQWAACAAALASMPATERPDAMRRLRLIRDAVPGFDATMREEAAQMQLLVYGSGLGEGFKSQLEAKPRLMVGGGGLPWENLSWEQRVLNRAVWRDNVAVYDEMAARAALRGPERDAAFEAMAVTLDGRLLSRFDKLPKPRDYIRYAQRSDVGSLRIDLVLLAGAAKSHRDVRGTWPTSLDALVGEKLLSSDERERLAAIRLSLDGSGLLMVLPLPRVTESSPVEARVHLNE